MPPRRPACSLRNPYDAIWISDDLLSSAWQRFCGISRTSRRHGSSVPGPMEFRRRLGRRRLTVYADAPPTPLQDFGSIWGFPPLIDSTQWLWLPPSKPPALTTQPPPKPPYSVLIAHYKSMMVDGMGFKDMQSNNEGWTDSQLYIQRIAFKDFRKEISKLSQVRDFTQLATIISSLNHDIVHLNVSDDTIIWALRTMDKLIHGKLSKSYGERLLLQAYRTAWTAVQHRGSKDLDNSVVRELLGRLANLRSNDQVQELAVSILRTIRFTGCRRTKSALNAVLESWIDNWVERLLALKHVPSNRTGKVIEHHVGLDRRIKDAHLSSTISQLALFLELLPESRRTLIPELMRRIIKLSQTELSQHAELAQMILYSWMSTITKISWMTGAQFVDMLSEIIKSGSQSEVAPENHMLGDRDLCILLVDYSGRHRPLEYSTKVRAAFEHSLAAYPRRPNAAWKALLVLISSEPKTNPTGVRLLFDSMQILKSPADTLDIFQFCKACKINLPVLLVKDQIRRLSTIDGRVALRLGLMYKRSCINWTELREEVTTMICDPSIPAVEIFRAVRIPSVEFSRKWPSYIGTKLDPAKVELVSHMAVAFASASAARGSNRQALRYVWQCAYYLRTHRAPLNANISRAIVRVGLINQLVFKKWIGDKRFAWIIDLVKKYEGAEVAMKVDQLAYPFKASDVARKAFLERASNPLDRKNQID